MRGTNISLDIQRSIPSILVMLVFLSSCRAQNLISRNCKQRCPIYIRAQSICASDGNLYMDECRAKCANSNNVEIFNCDQYGSAMCADKCKETVKSPSCEQKCPVYVYANSICASDGKIYMDECRAKCARPINYELFSCNLQDPTQCANKCKLTAQSNICTKNCPIYAKAQTICASDGKLYIDECRAQCVDENNYRLFLCKSNDQKECQKQCNNEISRQKCESKCPVYIRFTLGCGSDGNLYTDECRAKCKDPSLSLLFDCGYPVDQEACSEKCTNYNQNPNKKCPQCENDPIKRVCGYDGNLYDNACQSKCNSGGNFYEVLTSPDGKTRIQCKNYYDTYVCQSNCNGYGKKPVCASDGYIYINSCVTKCANLEVINYCGNNIVNCFTKCRY